MLAILRKQALQHATLPAALRLLLASLLQRVEIREAGRTLCPSWVAAGLLATVLCLLRARRGATRGTSSTPVPASCASGSTMYLQAGVSTLRVANARRLDTELQWVHG